MAAAAAERQRVREFAFEERKTITDLINHGLDHLLPARNYATTAEPRGEKRQRSRDFRRKPRHLDRCGAMADLGKIVIRLHPQPSVGGAAERLFEPKRHFRRDGAASGDEVVKLLARNAEPLCGLDNRNAHFLDTVANHLAGVRRVFHRHGVLLLTLACLVVVGQGNVKRVRAFKAEDNSPIRPYRNRPKALQSAFQRVQAITGKVHGLRRIGFVEPGENIFNSGLASRGVSRYGLRAHKVV